MGHRLDRAPQSVTAKVLILGGDYQTLLQEDARQRPRVGGVTHDQLIRALRVLVSGEY